MKGFETGKRLKKLGLKAQDTSELFFDNVRVPAENLLGGAAFENKRLHLPDGAAAVGAHADRRDRGGVGAGRDRLDRAVREGAQGVRPAGGQPTRTPATRWPNCRPKCRSRRCSSTSALELVVQDKLDTATASMAKYWTTDLQCKVMDECVQLHGGYGYMWEYPITRAYADARVQRIYGGTNEIMKEVITRAMGLGAK